MDDVPSLLAGVAGCLRDLDEIRDDDYFTTILCSPLANTHIYVITCPWAPGQMDYVAFLRRLEEMDFKGAVILENHSQADLEESLKRVRSL